MLKFVKQDSEVLIAINSQGLYVIDPVNVVSHDESLMIVRMIFIQVMMVTLVITIGSPLATAQVVLLGLKFEELSWDYAKPSQENNEDCLPCLFIQFCVIENGRRVSKILQVSSSCPKFLFSQVLFLFGQFSDGKDCCALS